MATRDLATNSKKSLDKADRLINFTDKELVASYKAALKEVREKIASLYEKLQTEPTKAQLTQFMRQSGIRDEIVNIMSPYYVSNKALIEDMSMQGIDTGFFNNGWSVDQATGVSQSWGMIDDSAVRAAAGIGGDIGELAGVMSEREAARHAKILSDAFTNYGKDSQKWIRQAIRQGIIQGESVPEVTKRLQEALGMSYNSAMRIVRTELLRSTGIGNQAAYDQARDNGAEIIETWDATLDSRTRASHGAADGKVKDNITGMYDLFGGVPGPRRTGKAKEDINCRCISVGEVGGLSPELRAIRDEGQEPYQSFETWSNEQGINTNRYGEQYNFNGS